MNIYGIEQVEFKKNKKPVIIIAIIAIILIIAAIFGGKKFAEKIASKNKQNELEDKQISQIVSKPNENKNRKWAR